jgi:hypothetical protein
MPLFFTQRYLGGKIMEKQKKKGRPRKPADDIKDRQIRVRLTDDEKEKLESLAKNYDISQSEFIRILINTYYEEFKSNIGGKANV